MTSVNRNNTLFEKFYTKHIFVVDCEWRLPHVTFARFHFIPFLLLLLSSNIFGALKSSSSNDLWMRTRCRRRQSNRRHIPPSRSREKNESKATEIPANSVDFVHSSHTFQRFLNFHFKVLKSSKEARKWRKLVAGNKVSFSRAIFGCHYPWPRTTKIFVPLCTGVEILATPLYKYLYTQYTIHNA